MHKIYFNMVLKVVLHDIPVHTAQADLWLIFVIKGCIYYSKKQGNIKDMYFVMVLAFKKYVIIFSLFAKCLLSKQQIWVYWCFELSSGAIFDNVLHWAHLTFLVILNIGQIFVCQLQFLLFPPIPSEILSLLLCLMTLPVVSFCYDTLYQTASKSCKIQAYIAYQKGPSSIAFDRFFQIATLQIKTFLSDKAKKLT